MPSKRKARKNFINYDLNKKKAWRKLKKKPVIKCKQINDFWDKKKTVQQNLSDMGLAFDANKAVKLPPRPSIIEEVPIKQMKPKVPEVLEGIEMEVALGEKEKRFLISADDVMFCIHMMEAYGENYKAMAKDKRNHFQLTPKQIRNKIRSFKRSKTQYQEYLDSQKKSQDVNDSQEQMET